MWGKWNRHFLTARWGRRRLQLGPEDLGRPFTTWTEEAADQFWARSILPHGRGKLESFGPQMIMNDMGNVPLDRTWVQTLPRGCGRLLRRDGALPLLTFVKSLSLLASFSLAVNMG